MYSPSRKPCLRRPFFFFVSTLTAAASDMSKNPARQEPPDFFIAFLPEIRPRFTGSVSGKWGRVVVLVIAVVQYRDSSRL